MIYSCCERCGSRQEISYEDLLAHGHPPCHCGTAAAPTPPPRPFMPAASQPSFTAGLEEIQRAAGNRIAAGVCGILIGSLGVHKFMLGLTMPGLVMLLVSILPGCAVGFTYCFFDPLSFLAAAPFLLFGIAGSSLMGTIGIVEGIIYLTKSDEDFYKQYIVGKRGWF